MSWGLRKRLPGGSPAALGHDPEKASELTMCVERHSAWQPGGSERGSWEERGERGDKVCGELGLPAHPGLGCRAACPL